MLAFCFDPAEPNRDMSVDFCEAGCASRRSNAVAGMLGCCGGSDGRPARFVGVNCCWRCSIVLGWKGRGASSTIVESTVWTGTGDCAFSDPLPSSAGGRLRWTVSKSGAFRGPDTVAEVNFVFVLIAPSRLIVTCSWVFCTVTCFEGP
jgi:hypothetical protein